jgi:hypothetical protein
MMTEPKPLASLSASLLARKGAARPAMRRQTALGVAANFGTHDDLGWNDMGYDVDPQGLDPNELQPTASGLSPMSRADSDADVRNAIDNAIDRTIVSPTISPIDGTSPIPVAAATPPVVTAQAELARAIAPEPVAVPVTVVPAAVIDAVVAPTPARVAIAPAPPRADATKARSAAGAKGAFAFTLRLDPERHLRLRLASATGNRSAQQIMVALLDDYLANQPDIDAFANRLGMAN